MNEAENTYPPNGERQLHKESGRSRSQGCPPFPSEGEILKSCVILLEMVRVLLNRRTGDSRLKSSRRTTRELFKDFTREYAGERKLRFSLGRCRWCQWCDVRSLPFFFTFCQVQFFEWRTWGGGGLAKWRNSHRENLPVRGASWKKEKVVHYEELPGLPKSHCATTLLDELGDGLSSGREFFFPLLFLPVLLRGMCVMAGECVTVSLSSFYLFLSPSCCVKFESL